MNFETYEVDLQNKSEEFLAVSPTGKVPVVVADGDSLYESNGVNQYLDEIFESPRLLPEGPKKRAYARIWMASAEDDFIPAVFVAGVGRERGFSEDRISEALEKLKAALGAFGALEERLRGREYLADEFSLADIAHAGNSSACASSQRSATSRLRTTRTSPPGCRGSRRGRATKPRDEGRWLPAPLP